MTYKPFIAILIVVSMVSLAVSFSYAQEREIEVHQAHESIVRYDVLQVAKNLMSCSAFYHVTQEPEQSAFFNGEAKDLFMIDTAQTEEETASWLAGASDYYRGYWENMDATETFEAAESMERHRQECINLKTARAVTNAQPVEK